MTPTVVGDADPQQVLAALEGPGPVAVLDHRRPVLATVRAALARVPQAWLVAFTSGSTARPRGVWRTRESWSASVEPLARLGVAPGSRVLVPGPLHSTLYLHAAWHARQVGARPVVGPLGTEGWDVAHVVPRQLDRLLASATPLAGRTVVVAGAALPSGLAERAVRAGAHVVAYYGAAELSFVAVGVDGGPLRPFPGAQVVSRDGVLWVRSPYLAGGYLLSDGTPGPLRREDGWATVGDRGEVVDGTVVVRGRAGGAVQTGGVTVHVADVEAVLREAPGVLDVVVVGTPHPDLGEVVTAAVEAVDPAVTRPALRAWCAARLPAEHRPRRWLVTAALPRTAAGKADRAAVAERLARRPSIDV